MRTELKTTTIPKYSPCPIERDSKYRVKTDVAQPETKKMVFYHYQRMVIVFMNLEILLYFPFMA